MTQPLPGLSGPAIDELASGQPGAATLELLRTGQAALRRALLLAAHRRAGEPAGESFALLGRAAAAARDPVEEIVTRPFAHAWGLHALASAPPAVTSDLAALATAVAIRAGLDADTTLEAGGGELFLPGIGLADRLHCTTVTVRRRHGRLAVGCPHPAAPAPRWRPARTVTISDGWTIGVEDQEPLRGVLGEVVTLTPAALDDAAIRLRQAWELIRKSHPGYAPAVRSLWRSVAPLSGDGGRATSSSSPSTGGCVAMDLSVASEKAAELLIHEVQHILLASAGDLTPFRAGPQRQWYRAPWKPYPRPAGALLQGVVAHAAVIDYWLTRWRDAPDDRAALWAFAYLREVTAPAIRALRTSGELTGAGRRLLDGLLGRVTGWAAVGTPEPVAALARRAGRAEEVAWRLDNLHVPDADARRLAEAYRAGLACPGLPRQRLGRPDRDRPRDQVIGGSTDRDRPRHQVIEGPPDRDRPHPVIEGLHAAGLGRQPDPGPDRTMARRAVAERPDDTRAWVTLAAVDDTPLLAERPDLLRTVLRLLHAGDGSTPPTPDALAAWLSTGWVRDHVAMW